MLFIQDCRYAKGRCRKEMDAPFLHVHDRPKSWLKQHENIPDRNEEKKVSYQKVVNHSSALPGVLFPWEDYWRSLNTNQRSICRDKLAGINPELQQGGRLERDLKLPVIYEHFNERNSAIDVIIVQKRVIIRSSHIS